MQRKNRWKMLCGLTFTITLLYCALEFTVAHAFSTPEITAALATGNEAAAGIITPILGTDASAPLLRCRHYAAQGDAGVTELENKDGSAIKAPDEVQNLKERILEIQNKGKLGFRKVVACRSVESFGSYSPIESGQSVDKVILYCEPSNVSTLKSDDRYIIDCAVDFFLVDATGKLLGGKKNALRLNRVSRSPVIDLYFKVEMRLKKFRDRTVLLKTVIHDKIKNQSASATMRVNLESRAKTKSSDI